MRSDDLLVYKSPVSTSEVVDEQIARVFVLQYSVTSGNSWVLLPYINDVLLPSNNIEWLL